MIFLHYKLYIHIIRKFNTLKLTNKEGCEKIGISRTTLFKIQKGRNINLDTFLKCCDWLETDLDDYIKRYQRPSYIQKRLDYRSKVVGSHDNIDDKYYLGDWKRIKN